MVYQVLIYFNEKKNKTLNVADSCEEFNKTTIKELKKKFRSSVPGAPDPDHLRVIFGKDPLEDHQTLEFYKIKHLSVLLFVMKMPNAGAVEPDPDPDLQFLQSLLPALKKMDLRHRERTKLKIQKLVLEEEFNYKSSSDYGTSHSTKKMDTFSTTCPTCHTADIPVVQTEGNIAVSPAVTTNLTVVIATIVSLCVLISLIICVILYFKKRRSKINRESTLNCRFSVYYSQIAEGLDVPVYSLVEQSTGTMTTFCAEQTEEASACKPDDI